MSAAFTAASADPMMHAIGARHGHLRFDVFADLRRAWDEAELRAATRDVAALFPVVACRYEPRAWRDRWVPAGPDALDARVTVEPVDGDLEARTSALVADVLEPETTCPLRVRLLTHAGGSRLAVSLVHVAGDGGGALAVVQALACRLTGRPLPPTRPARGMAQVLRALGVRRMPTLVADTWRELARTARLAAAGERTVPFLRAAPPAVPHPCLERFAFRGDGLRTVGVRAGRPKATLNDVLVAAVLCASARRTTEGPVAAIYTVNLRRFLADASLLVANLSGSSLIVLPRARVGSLEETLSLVVDDIAAQKRGLPGMGSIAPGLALSWLPHAAVRALSRRYLEAARRNFARMLEVSNVGALDAIMAPFGDDVTDAWVTGLYMRDMGSPVAVASGFRGVLSVALCTYDDVDAAALAAYARELRELLAV